MKAKKFMKSRNNRVLTGVLGGIAEYFGFNARYLRIAYVILTLLLIHTVIPILAYLALTVFMPNDDSQPTSSFNNFFGGENQAQRSKPDRKILHDVEEKDDHK
ncbi:PspC domain-containing protein [Lactobacillaceae bacterium Scapto_B20]